MVMDDPHQGTWRPSGRVIISCVMLSGGLAAGIATRGLTGSLRLQRALDEEVGEAQPAGGRTRRLGHAWNVTTWSSGSRGATTPFTGLLASA